jgi:hypothetical protein
MSIVDGKGIIARRKGHPFFEDNRLDRPDIPEWLLAKSD